MVDAYTANRLLKQNNSFSNLLYAQGVTFLCQIKSIILKCIFKEKNIFLTYLYKFSGHTRPLGHNSHIRQVRNISSRSISPFSLSK